MRTLQSRPAVLKLAATAVATTALVVGCSNGTLAQPHSPSPATASAAQAAKPTGKPAWKSDTPTPSPRTEPPAELRSTSVVVISADGLASRAITSLGPTQLPHLYRLMKEGSSTLNARTETELSLTLPNHTGMVTGRRIEAATGGHGVTWNDDRRTPATVQQAAGHDVASVFDVVHDSGGSTALFASKTKFSLWQRSWPKSLDQVTINLNTEALTQTVVADLNTTRALRFVHLADADVAGHAYGWMSPQYLDAVRRVDRLVGRIARALHKKQAYRNGTTVILTADHGGHGKGHYNTSSPLDVKVPFIVAGHGVKYGSRLYRLNPDYRNPGASAPSYAAPRQPVRNGDVANLATSLLGLPALPQSEHNARQNLDVR